MDFEERAEMMRRLEAERREAEIETQVIVFRSQLDVWDGKFPGDAEFEEK